MRKRTLFLVGSALGLSTTSSAQVVSGTSQVPAGTTVAASGICADSLTDQAAPGTCVQASSIPTIGMLLPLGPEFYVSPTGDVGIGTTSPISKLGVDGGGLPGVFASTDSLTASAVTGWAPATVGSSAFGLYGESDGDAGTGTLGWARDQTGGFTYGLYGQSDSSAGTGALGWATSLNGYSVGVSGQSDSALGTGVFGWASDNTGGITSGVYGKSDSANGVGVYGWASDATGLTVGVSGHSDSGQGTGVLGWATASTGSTSGVRGASDADLGAGVEGFATEATGANYGVFGATSSPAGYGVFSSGDMGATGVKSFVQPHPADASKEIRFVCLEGNESGTYFRGTGRLVNGRAVISVPKSFALVSEPQSLTVQLTPTGQRAVLWTESESLDTITVRGDADVRFHYFVNGIRRGFADFEPIQENRAFVPRTRGQIFGSQYPAGLRRVLVENGILNPDGTPNEWTAARQGWPLGDEAHADRGQRPAAKTPSASGRRVKE